MTEVVGWLAALTGLLAAAAAFARWVVRPIARVVREGLELLSDLRGEPGRDGVPARPGVMARLERIEYHVGNGQEPSLRQVVDTTARELHEHLEQAGGDK